MPIKCGMGVVLQDPSAVGVRNIEASEGMLPLKNLKSAVCEMPSFVTLRTILENSDGQVFSLMY